jgi:thiol-disulfide isomerase/thioredoxin
MTEPAPLRPICVWLLTLLVLASSTAHASADEKPGVGRKYILTAAADFQFLDLQSKRRALREWGGQPLLINYWASWCAPCLQEMPELDAFAKAQAGVKGGVRVLGIAADEAGAVRAFAQRIPVSFPILIETIPDGGRGSASLFGHTGGRVPYSVLLNAQGQVVHSKAGPVSRELLQSWSKDLRRED